MGNVTERPGNAEPSAETVSPPPDLSLVVALYFEEECVEEFVRQVRSNLDPTRLTYEIVFVDDGSTDRTVELASALAADDPRIKLIVLTRNHGKAAAVSAGIARSQGRYVILMDPDLQDPPDRIVDFYEQIEKGYDVVYGIRLQKSDTWLNTVLSDLFWSFLRTLTGLDIPKGLAVMRIFNRKFADEFLRYPERVRFIEGIFIDIGMRRAVLPVENRERFAGTSKFNFRQRIRLAVNAIIAFSDRPLRLSVTAGMLLLLSSTLGAGYLLLRKLVFGVGLTGWTSTILAIMFVGGLNALLLGIVGTYLGRLYTEVKARPLYRIQNTVNLEEAEPR